MWAGCLHQCCFRALHALHSTDLFGPGLLQVPPGGAPPGTLNVQNGTISAGGFITVTGRFGTYINR